MEKSATGAAGPHVEELAHRVIGAAIEVHREMGPGFAESTYEEALAYEFGLRGIPYKRQCCVKLYYKEHPVGEGRLDFLVGERLVVELKAVESVLPVHVRQVVSYLKATEGTLGLLLNFNDETLLKGLRRVVLD